MKTEYILLRVVHDGKRSGDDIAEHAAQRAYTLDHVSDATVMSVATEPASEDKQTGALPLSALHRDTYLPSVLSHAR